MMPIRDEMLYEEIGRAWLYFDSWREKIFAGYLSVLAALAFAFSKSPSIPIRTAVFAFAVVVSGVFWMLDFRTTQLINLCQAAGEKMAESKGSYGELNQRRFEKAHRVSFGVAVSVLVSSVIATGVVGCLVSMLRWGRWAEEVGIWWSFIAVALAGGVFWVLHSYAHNRWLEERENYKKRLSKQASGSQNKHNVS